METSPDVVTQEELEESISAEAAARENYHAKVAAFELASGGLWKKRIDQATRRSKHNSRRSDSSRMNWNSTRSGALRRLRDEGIYRGRPVGREGRYRRGMIQIQEVDLEVAVLEAYAPNLRVGLEATIELDTHPDQIFTGGGPDRPLGRCPVAELPVKIRIDNQRQNCRRLGDGGSTPQMQLMPGMFARANLPGGSSRS